jgi:hypothetical protein
MQLVSDFGSLKHFLFIRVRIQSSVLFIDAAWLWGFFDNLMKNDVTPTNAHYLLNMMY